MVRMSVGRAWDETQGFLRREAGLVIPVALALIGLPLALGHLVLPEAIDLQKLSRSEALPLLARVLPFLAVSFVGNFALIALALVPGISVGEAIGLAFRRIWVFLAAAWLIMLAGMAALTVLTIILALGGVAQGNTGGAAAGLTVAVGFVGGLSLVAGVRLALLNMVIVGEPLGPIAAIRRAWALSHGQFLRLLGLLLMFVVLLSVIGLAVQGTAGLVALLVARAAGSPFTGRVILALLDGTVNAAGSVLVATMGVALYRQLSGRSISGT